MDAEGASGAGRLRAEHLAKAYKGRRVVDDVTLDVEPGEIVGLLGPNGAGKTTTFNMIVGLTRADAGTVTLGDIELTRLAMFQRARIGLGYLPQEASVFRRMTVRDNLMAIAETLPVCATDQRARVTKLLADMGLAHLAEQRAYALSGGERRRVEISRALVLQPRYLLLDEPFSGVDPKSVSSLQEIIRALCERGLGILITDHSVRETLDVVDRAYLIHDGAVVVSGSSRELVEHPVAKQVYLGDRFRYDAGAHLAAGGAETRAD